MTPSSAPAIIGAMAMRARRKVRAHFLAHHAVSAGDAVPFVPQSGLERRQFEHLQRVGIVRQAGGAGYWLDLAAERQHQERQRAVLVPLVILLSLAIAGAIMLLY